MSEIRTSEIRTKFCSVFQTERSDFGHLMYFKNETKKSEENFNVKQVRLKFEPVQQGLIRKMI